MKIIILGGAGFIGQAIVSSLSLKGYRLLVIDGLTRLQRNKCLLKGITTQPMDYPSLDFDLLNGLMDEGDILIHLACTTNPPKSMLNPLYDAESNIIPSIKLFNCAIENKLSKIIFASSGGTIYGETQHCPIIETTDKNPISAYGVSKLTIEHYLSILTNGTHTNGINLRIANPFGSYQLQGTTIGAIAAFINAIRGNKPINIWGNGKIIRDYLYIDDLAQAFLSTIEAKEISGSFNIGSGVGHSINQILKMIEDVTQTKAKICYHDNRAFDVPEIVLNSLKFTQHTGWKPQYKLDEGIRKILKKLNK